MSDSGEEINIQQLYNFLILIGMISLIGLRITNCYDKFKNEENKIYPENVQISNLNTIN